MDPQAGPQLSRVEGYSLAQPQPKGLPFGTGNVPRLAGAGRAILLSWIPLAALCAGLAPLSPAQAADAAAGAPARAGIEMAAADTKPASDATGALPSSSATKAAADHEAAYYARLDKITGKVLDYDLSKDDAKNIRDAISALYSDDVDKAAGLRAQVRDPLGRKLIDWYRLRKGHGDAAEYASFLKDNPHWPSREILQRRMEEALFANGGTTDVITGYFAQRPPTSAAGMAALASVHLAHGEKDKAAAIASKIWREHDLSPELERGFLARFGPLLSEDDHKWRLDRLLVEDVRWKRARNEQADKAKRVIPLLSKAEQEKAKARLAVFLRKTTGKIKTAAKPEDRDWGLVFHKIQHLRRRDKLEDAAKLMLEAPTDPDEVVNLDDWWTERQKLAYKALKENKPKLAYKLVEDAGPLSVNPLNEQAFMAGWIALRYLKDAKAARRHFADYTKTADGPLSRAKSNYWLGRAAEADGDDAAATAAYREAARQPDTFHGLLALQKLEPGRRHITIEPPAAPTPDQIARFESLDLAKAVALADKADLSRTIKLIFLKQVDTIEDSEAWAALSAHLARAIGDTQVSVRIGKAAISRGHNLIYYSYPVHALPKYKPLRPPPETAVLLGLARQETEFNSSIVSGAGARGILQVMRGTAKHVCRQYKIKYSTDKLLHDSSYNTMIASAYVADRMEDFSGSYILGLSSYNAGPGRTREWIREFGDPRDAHIDPIDWIERIPIEETRRYVAKVLSNIQIYRARLGDAETALRLDKDLRRAKQAAVSPPVQKPEHMTSTARSGG